MTPGLTTGVWIDDLCAFDAEYLSQRFRPWQQGISKRTTAVALHGAAPETRSYLAERANREVRELLTTPLCPPAAPGETLAAQTQLVATYFWEMAYHARPDVYELLVKLQDVALEALFPANEIDGRTVADIGTGGGRAVPYLARHAAKLWGIDPCGPLLDLARRKIPAEAARDCEFVQGAFDDIPLPDQSVDVVTSTLAFQLSEERGGKRGLAEVERVLRPGGHAILVVGHAATADFLRREGLTERLPRAVLRWRRPPESSPVLLRRLVELGGAKFPDGACEATTPLWSFELRRD